jgi:hypothetical protein
VVRAVRVVTTPWRPDFSLISQLPMIRQTVISKKKRGPPATGKGTPIVVRMQPGPLSKLDTWVAAQQDKLSRPEAIRRLVELGLKAKR